MKKVVSASRRTDIPLHHLDWLILSLKKGWVDVPNPFNGRKYRVSLKKSNVHTLVLWSKDFRRFLKFTDEFLGYNLFFHFTINSPSSLEGTLSPLPARLAQLKRLVESFGTERVVWRFDPILFWKETRSGRVRNNLNHFGKIAEAAANAGVTRCITSFVTPYKKVVRRMRKAGLELIRLSIKKRREIAAEIAEKNRSLGIRTYACCNPDIVGAEGIEKAHCIDGELLSMLAGEVCDMRKDRGQRPECGCTVSVDVGRYGTCPVGCLYCYARK